MPSALRLLAPAALLLLRGVDTDTSTVQLPTPAELSTFIATALHDDELRLRRATPAHTTASVGAADAAADADGATAASTGTIPATTPVDADADAVDDADADADAALPPSEEAVLHALLSPFYAVGFQRPHNALAIIQDARVFGAGYVRQTNLPPSAAAMLSELRTARGESTIGHYEKLEGGLEAMAASQPPFGPGDTELHVYRRIAAGAAAMASVSGRGLGSIKAHVYVSGPGVSALGNHSDEYAVGVLAMQGTKEWLVCAPRQECIGEEFTAAEVAAMRCSTIEMRPGDLLYLPSGTVHSASAGGRGSTHIAFGIRPTEEEQEEQFWACLVTRRKLARPLQWGVGLALVLILADPGIRRRLFGSS